MRNKRYICISLLSLFLLLVSIPLHAQIAANQDDYNAVFVKRSDSLKANLTREALANLKEGKRIDIMEMALLVKQDIAKDQVFSLIKKETDYPYRGGMFYIHDMMALYLEAYDHLTPELRKAIRHSFKVLPLYRGDTENHFLSYYTGLYLAAQTWPSEPETEWFDGKSSSQNLKEARDYILSWMNLTTTRGQGEFDSPTYILVYLSNLFSLYNYCEDPVLKSKTRKMIDYILADYAVEYLHGLYAGAHSRDYPYDVVKPSGAPAAAWGWLLFGDAPPLYLSNNLPAAWSGYRLPVIIQNVATDRSKPYEHFERKRVRNIIRYRDGKGMNPPVYKTDYMTSTYCLGSIQGGILQPIQQHTWDVTYVDGNKPNTTIFTVNPYYASKELAMFFPEEEKWLIREVDRYHTYYINRDKWTSSSPYERTFQYKNAIIVLYNIPDDGHFKQMDGFFPKTLERRDIDPSGWIFCKGGENYIAVFPLKPYKWIDEDVDWRLRSNSQKNGVVLEVDPASKFSSFEAFKQQIKSNKLDTTGFDSNLSVHYTTTDGNKLNFSYPNKRVLNGKPYDLTTIPLFKGPYLNGDGKSQSLMITHGGQTYRIDFKKDD